MSLEILLAPAAGLEAALRKSIRRLPFADQPMGFVSAFSGRVLGDHTLRGYPDLTALAFWMRPAHLKELQVQFEASEKGRIRVPRGLVFHLAPANVDTLFAYSLLLSLLLGNKNIVRLSRRGNLVQEQILTIFRELLSEPDFAVLADDLLVVRYDHDAEITTRLSARCDCRIIWGGDRTVQEISALPLPPTATEIKFANKWSLALFDAARLLQLDEAGLVQLARSFVNDCYWYGQAACSSPRAVFWRGEKPVVADAQQRFWPSVEAVLQEFDHRLSASDFVNKLTVCCAIAAERECAIPVTSNNLLNRIEFAEITPDLLEHHCGGGLFLESTIRELTQLRPLLSKQIQTLVCFGIGTDAIVELVRSVPLGVDRIVPFGKALNFDVYWDGYDLLEELTRGIAIA
ncbi:MAG: acyl-CoA reductase [Deltaproteobacteria bacterium]